MSIELKGINNLLKKLDQVSKISGKEAINSAAETAVKSIREDAHSFSNNAYKHIAKCSERSGNHYCYIDVGLRNDNAPFEEWKSLYYQNYGYQNRGWNFEDNGPYINKHALWFTNAVNAISPKLKKEIKEKLKKEVQEEWKK